MVAILYVTRVEQRTPIQIEFEKLPGMNCFACAPRQLNASGLNLVFEETPEGAKTTFSIPNHFQSYPGYIHGGILCSVLDETMAYAGIFKKRKMPFTRAITLTFRHAVAANLMHCCTATITNDMGDGFSAKAVIKNLANASLVLAKAQFMIPTPKMVQRMMGAGWSQLEELFAKK